MISTGQNKHLLIVDDEADITKSIYRQFRRKYTVHTVTSGRDALKVMEDNPIQVILSDQRMPGMTGVEFFNIVRTKYPNAIKLILTGYSDIEAVIGAINQGQVFRYLTKPWNPMELEMAIQEAFEKHDLLSENRKLMSDLKVVNETLEEKVKLRTEDLVKTNQRLKLLNIEKNKYIGIVAHDLRSPIGNAYSFSDLLIKNFHRYSNDEKIHFLNIINSRCDYSLKMIENFLDASKIESGILDLNYEKCDYITLVNDCIAQNMLFAINKNQNIELNTSFNTCEVHCDRDKIDQVLNNLINNAIKYSEQGKTIRILVKCTDKEIYTSVVDEGKGINKQELGEVFKAFKTTSTKATAGEKSTGLGLAIVKKIIEAHNGTLKVESEVNQGSIFSFTIPI